MKTLSLFVLLLCGCSLASPPPILKHHWRRAPFGAELYDESGKEIASFIRAGFGNPAQVCYFSAPEVGCQYFETDKQALEFLTKEVESHNP